MKKIPIIAISGTSCSGKGTLVDYFKKEFGFVHRSIRQTIKDAGSKLLDIPIEQIVTRDHFRSVGIALRKKYGPTCLIDFILETAPKEGPPLIIESVRALAEMYALKNNPNFYVTTIFLDAPHERRHAWSLKRKDEAEMNNGKPITLDEFIEREKIEWSSKEITDPTKVNVSQVALICDHTIINNGTLDDFHTKIKQIAHKKFAHLKSPRH